MGRHKELTCSQCGFVYTVNASHEVEGATPFPFTQELSQLPVSVHQADRVAQLQGRSDPGDDVPVRSPFLPGHPHQSGGTSSSSAIPKSRRSVTSSG